MNPVNIAAKTATIRSLKHCMTGQQYFSRQNDKLREWDILGTVIELLRQSGLETPAFAAEHEGPDFLTYRENGSQYGGIEITEALSKDYKRGDFWKQDALADAPEFYDVEMDIAEPWVTLRSQIQKKSAKPYAAQSSLFVYFNIGRLSFEDWHTPFGQQLLVEHSIRPFSGASVFTAVYVLSSNMSSLVELHPTPRTIANGVE
jgi:hypothetical protein